MKTLLLEDCMSLAEYVDLHADDVDGYFIVVKRRSNDEIFVALGAETRPVSEYMAEEIDEYVDTLISGSGSVCKGTLH